MKKKLFSLLAIAVVAAVASLNVYSAKNEVKLSDLAMANVEALAGDEGYVITCSRSCSDGIGRCWTVIEQYGNCETSGKPTDYCTCN